MKFDIRTDIDVKCIMYCNDITSFVEKFKLEELFKQLFKVSIEDWDYECGDDECIGDMLEHISNEKELYYCNFVDEDNSYFEIWKITYKGGDKNE
jgi:hypothetical protein